MNSIELSLLIGFAFVIALLVRIERLIRIGISRETIYRDRQSLEVNVRDLMPTLWFDYEFRNNIVPWFALATGQYDKSRLKEWHWSTIASNLEKSHIDIPLDEIEYLGNLSKDFFHEACQSRLLSELEVRYLLFWLWNLNFSDPTVVILDDVNSFKSELSNLRERFLKKKDVLKK
ncbi:MAG: hypothetical protein OEL55_06815 [Desulfobulbaceae bacterium]|nr:hypothetical protein [Desulfobulbaceae bacterium]